jgi:hypothetical protein
MLQKVQYLFAAFLRSGKGAGQIMIENSFRIALPRRMEMVVGSLVVWYQQ